MSIKVTYKKGTKGKLRSVTGPDEAVEEYIGLLQMKYKKLVIVKTTYNI